MSKKKNEKANRDKNQEEAKVGFGNKKTEGQNRPST